MASLCFYFGSVLHCNNSHTRARGFHHCKQNCSSQSTSMVVIAAKPNVRRSANYEPSIWSFDHVQSLSSKYIGEEYKARANTLKESVKTLIHKDGNPLSTLELVDDLQRLGISYHFEDKINEVLEMIYFNYFRSHSKSMGLNLKALGFRLLRQHGYQVPQEIFYNFKDESQNLNPKLLEDMVGMLNLYEASYHSFEDESILDEIRDFTTKYLEENFEKVDGSYISLLVSHALELPLHWRVPRVETKWFIKVHEERSSMDPTLIELAKLDFNMAQCDNCQNCQPKVNKSQHGQERSNLYDRNM